MGTRRLPVLESWQHWCPALASLKCLGMNAADWFPGEEVLGVGSNS